MTGFYFYFMGGKMFPSRDCCRRGCSAAELWHWSVSAKHVRGTNVNPLQNWFHYIWISSLLAPWPRLSEIFTGGLSRHSRNSQLWSSPHLRRAALGGGLSGSARPLLLPGKNTGLHTFNILIMLACVCVESLLPVLFMTGSALLAYFMYVTAFTH